jgi:integrase
MPLDVIPAEAQDHRNPSLPADGDGADNLRTVNMRGHRFHMAKSHLKLVAPTEVKRTVAPKRQKNADPRTREHLTPDEVEALTEAARGNRCGHRDATMILLTYRHGLRAAEVCDLRWDQVDFSGAVLHVRRVKNGTPSTHPFQGDELRALRRLHREPRRCPSCSSASADRRSPRPGWPGSSSAPRLAPAWSSRRTRTCCATPAATPSPTRGTTPGPFRDGSDIGRSPAPRSIRRWRLTGSRTSGGTDRGSESVTRRS